MGLGSANEISLAEARDRAATCRKLLLDGLDPIEEKKRRQEEARLAAAKTMTFADCAKAYVAAHRSGWRNPKHIQQWERTLELCKFRQLPVSVIDTELVLQTLEPLWRRVPETASRLRGRIESVLDFAKVRAYRSGENPARWKGNLKTLLPERSRVRAVEHHAALPYREIARFVEQLRRQPGVAAKALEFLILTAARTGEVTGATWKEISFEEKIWTIPAARMKGHREHRVPLSPRALDIVRDMHRAKLNDYVFPGLRPGKPLSNMSMAVLLRRMGCNGTTTVHGLRSTFRDWAAEQTSFPREVAEAALAHALESKVEASYFRGDILEKRRKLMVQWQRYCETTSEGKVTSMKRSKTAA